VRPPTDRYWKNRTRSLLAEDPARSAASIARQLEREARDLGRDDWPSPRTVQRIKNDKDWDRLALERVSWPDAMERGLLPWEASRVLLDLIALRGSTRPTVLEARWAWWFHQAAPELSGRALSELARRVWEAECLNGTVATELRRREWWLAYRPWRSWEATREYAAGMRRMGLESDILRVRLFGPAELVPRPLYFGEGPGFYHSGVQLDVGADGAEIFYPLPDPLDTRADGS